MKNARPNYKELTTHAFKYKDIEIENYKREHANIKHKKSGVRVLL